MKLSIIVTFNIRHTFWRNKFPWLSSFFRYMFCSNFMKLKQNLKIKRKKSKNLSIRVTHRVVAKAKMLFQTAGRWNCLLFVQMNLEAKMQTFTEQFAITNSLVQKLKIMKRKQIFYLHWAIASLIGVPLKFTLTFSHEYPSSFVKLTIYLMISGLTRQFSFLLWWECSDYGACF